MAAYNATNRLNRGDPDTGVTDSNFGQALYQGAPGGTFGAQGGTYGNQSGRQVELGLRSFLRALPETAATPPPLFLAKSSL